ncbi:hypothetical protein a10_08244 [Streptomyces acidiscabies]|nr:hypothetical protein a10_08244 [Streptomyces acidiscabies]
MNLRFHDTAALRRPVRQARSGPYITGGRSHAPTPTDQLHSRDHEIPAPQGGYLHAQALFRAVLPEVA